MLGTIPIREVTVFKDGHAFVVHEGTMPVNARGRRRDRRAAAAGARDVLAVRRRQAEARRDDGRASRRVLIERTALDVRSLLEANPGAEVIFVDGQGRHAGVVVGVPARSAEELARTEPPGGGEQRPAEGQRRSS